MPPPTSANARDDDPSVLALLRAAVTEGTVDSMAQLLQTAFGVNDHADKDESTLLHYAAQEGFLKGVEFLMEKGADVEAVDSERMTPLHCAAEGGFVKVVCMLVSAGAEIDPKNTYSHTPLQTAAISGHNAAASCLIELGANIKLAPYFGQIEEGMMM